MEKKFEKSTLSILSHLYEHAHPRHSSDPPNIFSHLFPATEFENLGGKSFLVPRHIHLASFSPEIHSSNRNAINNRGSNRLLFLLAFSNQPASQSSRRVSLKTRAPIVVYVPLPSSRGGVCGRERVSDEQGRGLQRV